VVFFEAAFVSYLPLGVPVVSDQDKILDPAQFPPGRHEQSPLAWGDVPQSGRPADAPPASR